MTAAAPVTPRVERFELTVDAARGVHALLAGRATPLAELLVATRAARQRGGAVDWEIPVEPRTVHRLEGLLQLAADEGVATRLGVAGQLGALDARERAVLADLDAAGVASVSSAVARGRAWLRELGWALRWAARWALASLRPRRRRSAAVVDRLERVLLIGAYGGDHVGDTAILGGVLLSLAARHGTTSATVLSHRPQHTARLAAGLETPVALAVADYDRAPLAALLESADAVVVAGGPLMDLPKVLVRHLAVAAAARARGLPLLVERVGIGPFRRAVSRRAARRLARQAARISVRSAASARDPVLHALAVEVGRDPAFDYLESRATLGRLRPAARDAIAELLAGSAGRLRVGVNVRPIRHLWSERGSTYSRQAYEGFLDRLAEGMVAAADARGGDVCYVFFPMNPIRFGLSDLDAAYRLQRRLAGRAELRVWEADPDVDDLLHLLRQLDAAVAMRLHAAIFALSQGLRVFGVDYYPGHGGKVEELFADLGRPSDVRRIDRFDAAWLVAGLAALRPRDRAETETSGD